MKMVLADLRSKTRLVSLLGALGSLLLVMPAHAEEPVLKTGEETWIGQYADAEKEITVFKGLPYAQPPIGDLRWKAPEERVAGKGTHLAQDFGPACIQTQRLVKWERHILNAFGRDGSQFSDLVSISEDCLYLNIWAPRQKMDEKLPVMVWVYGGSNSSGWAHTPFYDGTALAKKGVILVTLNYRVGAMGYFAHPALSRENKYNVSGNYGNLDQIRALKWVRKHIGQLGGDVDNITIFGQSAGGTNVLTLMASPLARGLFRNAIVQSGNVTNVRLLSDEEVIGKTAQEKLGFPKGLGDEELLARLRDVSAENMALVVDGIRGARMYGPTVDGYVLPETRPEVFRHGPGNAQHVMIGTTQNEFTMFMDKAPDEAGLKGIVDYYSGDAEKTLEILDQLSGEDNSWKKADRIQSAGYFLCPSTRLANSFAENGTSTYFYRFTHQREGATWFTGAYHASELAYVFGTGQELLPTNEVDLAVTERLQTYWTNFARTGNPNGAGVPDWPRWSKSGQAYMQLGDEASMAHQPEKEICALSRF